MASKQSLTTPHKLNSNVHPIASPLYHIPYTFITLLILREACANVSDFSHCVTLPTLRPCIAHRSPESSGRRWAVNNTRPPISADIGIAPTLFIAHWSLLIASSTDLSNERGCPFKAASLKNFSHLKLLVATCPPYFRSIEVRFCRTSSKVRVTCCFRVRILETNRNRTVCYITRIICWGKFREFGASPV